LIRIIARAERQSGPQARIRISDTVYVNFVEYPDLVLLHLRMDQRDISESWMHIYRIKTWPARMGPKIAEGFFQNSYQQIDDS